MAQPEIKPMSLSGKIFLGVFGLCFVFGLILVIATNSGPEKQEEEKEAEQGQRLTASDNSFREGMEALGAQNYLVALNKFQGVVPEDTKNYEAAQDKIVEAKEQLALVMLAEAKTYFSQGDYEKAYSVLQEASLLTSPPLPEISQLMPDYEKEKEAQEAEKRAEAERQKIAEAVEKMKTYEYGAGPVGIAVTKVKTSSTVDGDYGRYHYVKDPDRSQFLWLQIAVRNKGQSVTHINPNYFTVSDPDGYTSNYSEASFSTSYLDAINLSPGTYTSGWLIFVVPKAKAYTLQYNSRDSAVVKAIIIQ